MPDGKTCCWNMPCEKWNDQFQCLRGGGSPDGVTPKNCGWTVDSENVGDCACVPPLVHSNYTLADFVIFNPTLAYDAPYDCRCPFTTDEQWLRLDVCNPPGVSKLAIELNFAKPSLDSISLKGTLAVPAGFSAAGATIQASIGGVVKTFTLDAKGKAKVGADQAGLRSRRSAVSCSRRTPSWNQVQQGLVRVVARRRGSRQCDGHRRRGARAGRDQAERTMYARAQPQKYSAKQGKTGRTK